jgi:2-oxoglutarate ferredoxin oxidoreductase subunit alpha
MKEAVDALSPPRPPLIKGGQRGGIAMLHFSEIYPFPSSPEFLHILNKAKKTICIENNATGQFARLMRAEAGYEFKSRINKYDGRPFIIEDLIGEINAVIG